MRRHLEAGVSAAQAAQLALAETSTRSDDQCQSAGLAPLAGQLRAALDRLDEPGAHAVLDRLLATFTLETVLRDVLLPYLHELGERWERGEHPFAQEHFASNLLRGRLLGPRAWLGPRLGPDDAARLRAGRAPRPAADRSSGSCSPAAAGRSRTSAPTRRSRRFGSALARVGARTSSSISASARRRLRAAEAELTELARRGSPRPRRRGAHRRRLARAHRGDAPRRRPRHRGRAHRGRASMSVSGGDPPLERGASRARSTGAFESVQRVRLPAPVVEHSAAGAKRLGDAVLARARALDARPRPSAGRAPRQWSSGCSGSALHCSGFGPPELSVTPSSVTCRYPILGGLLARHAGRLDLVHADGCRRRRASAPRSTASSLASRTRRLRRGWNGLLYPQLQTRLHVALGRRYFARLRAEAAR